MSDLTTWLREEMKAPAVANAAVCEGVDGATALQMDKDDWKELGSTGVKAAKLVAAFKNL